MATWEAVTKDGRSVKNGGEPTGRWRVRYRDSTYGSPKSIPAETETEAIETAGLVEAWHKLNPGVPYPRETRGRVVPTPLGDVAVKWLRDLRNTAPTTVALYSRNIETFAKSLPGGLDGSVIGDVNDDTVAAWDAARIAEGIGQNTRDGELGSVQQLHAYALTQRRTVDKPNGFVGVKEVLIVNRPGARSPKPVAPTWTEEQAVIARIDPIEYPNEYKRAVIHYYTGIRTFQVTGSFWAHTAHRADPDDLCMIFNPDDGTMKCIRGKTKAETEAKRHVPLAPAFVALLKEWRDQGGDKLVTGSQVGCVGRISAAWKAATDAGEVKAVTWAVSVETGRGTNSPCHAFRRGLTSNLKREKADTEGVEYYVGHAMPGVRASYLDPDSLDSLALVALIPPLPVRTVLPENVVKLVKRPGRESGWHRGAHVVPVGGVL